MALPSARKGAVAIIMALACVAMVCWVHMAEDTAVVKEIDALDSAITTIEHAIVTEEEDRLHHTDKVETADQISDALAGDAVTPTVAASADVVHSNIVALKAYCVAVQDAIHDEGDVATSSIIPFLVAFGAEPENNNIILEYSQLYAKFSDEFNAGMGLYILQHMNSAMLSGHGVITQNFLVGNNHYVMDYTQLGLESLPDYLKDLKITIPSFLHTKGQIEELADTADAHAAATYLKGKHNEFYVSFLDAEIAKADAIRAGKYESVVEAAFRAEDNAYSESYAENNSTTLLHVSVQSPAGRHAADAAAEKVAYVEPTTEELEAAAQAAADEFLTGIKGSLDTTAAIISAEEKELMGVTLTFKTSDFTSAESSMKPHVLIKGTKADIEGSLLTIGLPDETFHQTFASDSPVGEIVSVTLTAEGSSLDPWLCSGAAVTVGDTGEGIALTTGETGPGLFWLEVNGTNTEEGHAGFPHADSWTLVPAGSVAEVTPMTEEFDLH